MEIKFGEEIYQNRDYYAFLVHLAGKREYSMAKMLEKQDTLLEEMVVANMDDDDKERLRDMEFAISFGNEQVEIKLQNTEETFEVTDMIFERRMG